MARPAGIVTGSDPLRVTASAANLIDSVLADVDAGLVVLQHADGCTCRPPDSYLMTCIRLTVEAAVPSKCKDVGAPGVDPNPCTEPGPLPRCQICPKSPTYWRSLA